MNKWNKIKKTDLRSLGEAPTETSENIKAPELAPKDNRFTGRNKRIAFTCRPEFAEELRRLAFEKRCYQIEILEKAMEVYQKSLLSSEVKPQEEVHSVNQPINKIPANNYEIDEEMIDTCSFTGKDDKTGVIIAYCGKPSFDKKKQLCRSHSKQVWKRFNEFLKGKSISSDAAWLGIWQQSGDWKYFWELGGSKDDVS